ncbi:purine permease [Pediococcus pentosaceus]|uniref:nucleobase:cation symporter-2 family protein n=1 Tax=Pediococcus pentosaceus TaxID=1255 RepID=UPI001330B29A|nr:nucleobase:cation symporter-2 family protein [Pediococcus pentosaceus]KAF0507458.1 purine permease [Pediococcus pentosaceus]MBF7139126.1 purine permease [Pediococcus pentosaceus]MCM6820636.1 purine permease [Pediococcus pentosaceus]
MKTTESSYTEVTVTEIKPQLTEGKAAILGFQHLLAMYSGDVIVPLLIGGFLHFTAAQMTYLVSVDIFMCGIATLLQIKRTPVTGIGLPVVLGCAVQAVQPLQQIGGTLGVTAMYGAIIASGVFVFLVGGLFSKIKGLFPPIVTGSIITVIGFTLIPVAFQDIGGGNVAAKSFGDPRNLLVGLITVLIIVGINVWARGFFRSIAILIGILIGTIPASFMGMVSLSPIAEASWFRIPQPFYFGVPTFNLSAILTMIMVTLTTMIESTGVFFALGDLVGKEITQDDLKRGYRSEGIAAILGGIFNTFPYSTFSENVGVLQLSGVKSRKPLYYAAGFLIVLGLLPKAGATATIVPTSVLGGAMLVMFGIVGVQGVRILQQVNFNQTKNILIVSLSVGMGLGSTIYPQLYQALPATIKMLLTNGIVIASITAVVLNLLFNGYDRDM